MVATARGGKTPHRLPSCEELDPPYDVKLVFCVQKTVLRKINKICCHQSCTFSLQYAPNRLYGLGLRTRPHWGSLQRSPDPLAVFKGPTFKGREGNPGNGIGNGRKWEYCKPFQHISLVGGGQRRRLLSPAKLTPA